MNRYTAMMVYALIAGLLFPGVVEVAEADYVIYLRDGKQYVVDTFWVRGDLVGPLLIEKNRVAVIHDRETGENIIFNRFHTTQAYEAFRKSQEAQVRLRGKDPTCGEEKKGAKANYNIVQQDDLSYQGVGKVIMLQFRIQIAESMSEAELCHICKDIVGGQKQPYNAIRCWFYLPNSNTSGDYTAGESVWAPNGTWEDADDVRMGDYSQHKLVTLMGKRSDHIKRDETPLVSPPGKENLTEGETLYRSLFAAVDAKIISRTKAALQSLHIDVQDVSVVRADNGKPYIMITYAHTYGTESDHMAEIVKVLATGSAVYEHMRVPIESVVAVVGDKQGRSKALITAKTRDVELAAKTKDVRGYLKRWTVAIFDRSFLPVTAANMGW